MLKKYGVLMGVVALTAALAGCDVHLNGVTRYPDVVVVGETIPDDYGVQPSYQYSQSGRNPVIQSYTANPTNTVTPGQAITFQVVAYDPERDVLQYNWSATGGTLSTNSGQVVSWIPPDRPGVYTVMVTVANGRGGFVMGSQNLTVAGDGTVDLGGKAPSAAPTVTPSPAPSPTPTASPSAAPTPAPSASATASPAPSASPTPATDAGFILGEVRDANGPLAGATVTLESNDTTLKFSESFMTDEDGKYRFSRVPAGVAMVLSATKTGYDTKRRSIKAVKDTETTFDFEGTFALKQL